jgi:hypothetical protein
MASPKSRLIPSLCILYGLVAAGGLYLAVVGQKTAPAPLPLIDTSGTRAEQLDQARHMMEQAQQQQPDQMILTMFYKGWLFEFDYRSLSTYTQPRYDGDSFERRVSSYNETAGLIDEMYRDAVNTLAFLSSGSLILIVLMLWIPGYWISALLATYPVLVVFFCTLLDINWDPLEYSWVPFGVLGGAIFVLQLIFSFRFGRPEHRTVGGLSGLMIYRRGLFMLNFGVLLLVSALMMASGSLSGTGRSMWTRVGLAVFGEGGIVLIGIVAGIGLVIPGVYYMRRQPADDGG